MGNRQQAGAESIRPNGPGGKHLTVNHGARSANFRRRGRCTKKKMLKITSEASICMKTKKTQAKCHTKMWTFRAIKQQLSDILDYKRSNRAPNWPQNGQTSPQ